MKTKTINKNFKSCLFGGAIGDALGAPIEFYSIDKIIKKYGSAGITDYVEFRDGTGEFTDDTQMTLFTAEGLLRAYHQTVLKGINDNTINITYQSYLRWLYTQDYTINTNQTNHKSILVGNGWLIKRKELYESRAPGNTCISSLSSGKIGSIEYPINNSKGCGGVMRVAPVGLFYSSNHKEAFETASKIAAITHGHPSGYLSAGIFASIISLLTKNVNLYSAINESVKLLKGYQGHLETLESIEQSVEYSKLYLNKSYSFTEIPVIIE